MDLSEALEAIRLCNTIQKSARWQQDIETVVGI